MGGHIALLCLVLSIHTASSNPITTSASPNHTSSTQKASSSISTSSPSTTTPVYTQGLLSIPPSSSYEVTENVIDIPDNRTLAPIVPIYPSVIPLNLANTSINIDKNQTDVGGESKVKGTSFTYVHYSKEPDKEKENVFAKLFRGLKTSVFHLKKSWIDGLHSFVHRHDDCDKKKEDDSYNDFLRGRNGKKFEEDDDDYTFHSSYGSGEHFDYDHDEFKHDFIEY